MRFFFLFFLPLLMSFEGFTQKLPEKSYSILENKSIQADPNYPDSLNRYILADGNKMVFHFRQQTKKFDQTIAYDVGFREDVYFEVPKGVDSFELKDQELKEAKAFSKPECRCIPNWIFYDQGTIRGKKLNEGEWKVEIDVKGSSPQQPETSYSLQTTGIFRK